MFLLVPVEGSRSHIPAMTALILSFNTTLSASPTTLCVCVCWCMSASMLIPLHVLKHCCAHMLTESSLIHQHTPCVKGELERHRHSNLITISAGRCGGREECVFVCVCICCVSSTVQDSVRRERKIMWGKMNFGFESKTSKCVLLLSFNGDVVCDL